ncbi:MAG: phosphatidylglycerophosphatase A [Hyphomicrobiales bacterium]|nr:phosphatidylglycerophosphatase A [Hyphomicrobiales bacterium]
MDSKQKFNKKLPFYHPAAVIGTFFWVGKIPFASGTFGSLAACILLIILVFIPRELGWYGENMLLSVIAGLTFLFTLMGLWASDVYHKHGYQDPSEVVIDEVAGQFVAFTLTGIGYYFLMEWDEPTFLGVIIFAPQYLIALFLLFRLFDIWKPGPVGRADRMHNGLGIMLDDLIAGAFAAGVFFVLLFILLYSGALLWAVETFFPDHLEFMQQR